MAAKATWVALIGLGMMGMVMLIAGAGDGEQEVTLDQVPAAVKATILKESAGGKITEIERETRNGKTVYEAEFLLNGVEIEIRIAPDGTLLGREIENEGDDDDDLKIEQVPEPARSVLSGLANGARIVEVERERAHEALIYEATWIVNGTRHEAAVMADGTLVEIEETIAEEAAPPAVRAVIMKHFGSNQKVVVEKTMVVIYEVEAKINGKEREIRVLPTGRVLEGVDDDDDDDDDD